MTELRTKTLAQIVNTNYKTASVFEKYNLDFCCKGKRTLQEACGEIKLPVDQIISELDNISITGDIGLDFNKLSLTQLADYIVITHHAYVTQQMPVIFEYLQKLTFKHGEKHPEIFRIFETFAAVQTEMKLHMEKEEHVFFPGIKKLEQSTTENKQQNTQSFYLNSQIEVLEGEHDHAGSMLAEIRILTNNYTPPADACTTYRLSFASLQAFETDLHHHVHLENNILFPKALSLFKKRNEASLN